MGKTLSSVKKYTSVWLEPEVEGQSDKVKMFFCFNCRIPLIEYTGSVITLIPGHSPYNPSNIIKCKGNVKRRDGTWEDCGQFYSFISGVLTKNPETT